MSSLSSLNFLDEQGFVKKLWNGDFGLAKTYWLYGVLVSFVLKIIILPIRSTELLVLIIAVSSIYQIIAVVGGWRAATKYQGKKVWAILAKIALCFGGFMVVMSLLTIPVFLMH